eukprot:TRINITY_DN1679_c0_g1_i2.p5 TRINITY_DN1679_c0_g1~~TRINITY_DN1679_c0_g1_i2.p5  ORF type:complete len:107 (+),score=10.17 TRINITY_DN1679_c0_g1_i2:739-1059(+)
MGLWTVLRIISRLKRTTMSTNPSPRFPVPTLPDWLVHLTGIANAVGNPPLERPVSPFTAFAFIFKLHRSLMLELGKVPSGDRATPTLVVAVNLVISNFSERSEEIR